MVLIAFGSRRWNDRRRLFETCDYLREHYGVSEVWTGCAPGADALSAEWATTRSLNVKTWEANWRSLGREGGLKRSTEIITEAPAASMAVCFVPDTLDNARGSAHTIRAALERSLRVYLVLAARSEWVSPPVLGLDDSNASLESEVTRLALAADIFGTRAV
jgi:hypothetical protein